MIKTLTVGVYRFPYGECTNNGITSKYDTLTMFIDCEHHEAMKYCEENNIEPTKCLMLVRRTLWGERHDFAEPLVKKLHCIQMMGGNFVYTSDSRMHEWANSWQPIPVHDRYETQEEYDALSI